MLHSGMRYCPTAHSKCYTAVCDTVQQHTVNVTQRYQSHRRSAPPFTGYTVCCALLLLDSSAIQPPAVPSSDRVRRTLSSWPTLRCVIRTGNLTTSKAAVLILLRTAVDRAWCWCPNKHFKNTVSPSWGVAASRTNKQSHTADKGLYSGWSWALC